MIDILNLKDPDFPLNVRTSGETVTFDKKISQIGLESRTVRIGEPLSLSLMLLSD